MSVGAQKTEKTPPLINNEPSSCGECSYCNEPECQICSVNCSPQSPSSRDGSENFYTMCQIRRHNHKDSCWLVAGDTIYDATSYIDQHPGGATSILRKSGGVEDCSVDLHFHSKQGRRAWEKYIVGKVRPCGRDIRHSNDMHWWRFWQQ